MLLRGYNSDHTVNAPRAIDVAGAQDNRSVILMPAVSNQPVVYQGERVPNLYRRERADGSTVYEWAGREAGRSTRRKLRATSVAEAVREARRKQSSVEQSKRVESKRLSDAVDAYLAYLDSFCAVGEFSENTRHLYEQKLSRMTAKYGKRRVSELTSQHLSQLLAELRRDGLKQSTRYGYLVAWRSFFRYCVEQRLVDESPVDSLPRRERPSGQRSTPPRRLDVDQIESLFSELGPQFRPIVELATFQGFRISEALGLRWRDVVLPKDGRPGTINVAGQLYRGKRVDRVKTDASRARVPMLPRTAIVLRSWRSKQAELDLSLVKPDALVFSTLTGKPQNRHNVRRAVHVAAEAAGLHADATLPTVTTHHLRGSAGSIALADGMTLPEVSLFLRHASTLVTAKDYVDVLESARGEALGERLAACWGDAKTAGLGVS